MFFFPFTALHFLSAIYCIYLTGYLNNEIWATAPEINWFVGTLSVLKAICWKKQSHCHLWCYHLDCISLAYNSQRVIHVNIFFSSWSDISLWVPSGYKLHILKYTYSNLDVVVKLHRISHQEFKINIPFAELISKCLPF